MTTVSTTEHVATTGNPTVTRRDETPAAEFIQVTKRYGSTVVLDQLNLRVDAGEIVAIVGRSGGGKSTALRVLAGLSDDHDGTYSTSGAPAVAFQEPRLFPWRSVRANVGYGLTRSKLSRDEARHRVDDALAEVGLHDKGNAWPLTLSGGQAQRVSLARALVGRPQLLLLDEPFGALDALTRRSAHALLLRLWENHKFGVLLVTHDVSEAVTLADRVVVLDRGTIAGEVTLDEPRPRDVSTPSLAGKTRSLLSALGVEPPA